MGIVDKKLSKLFDFQKYEKEPRLQGVIDEAENSYSQIRRLTDDELEFAAGGVGGLGEDDPQAYGRCKVKDCSGYLKKTLSGYVCSNCGALYDKDKNLIDSKTGISNKGFKSTFK